MAIKQSAPELHTFTWHGINRKGSKVSGELQGETVNEVKEKFDGKELDTDKYVTEQIEKAVVGLDRKNKNIVMARLRDGKITTDNLGACLDRITELKKV